MADFGTEFVGRNFQHLPFRKTVGDALRDLVRRRHKHAARKHIERCWGSDPKTARNFIENANLSGTTLTKAAWAEGWDLWHELGVELFGETYAEHLQGAVDDYEQRRRRTAESRDHIRSLEARAAELVRVPDRAGAQL